MANGVAMQMFDTHAFVKRLMGAGLSVEVAETFATEQSRLIEQVSEKVEEELKEHKAVLREYKSELKEDFKGLEASLRKDNEILRKDMHHEISDLRRDMLAMEERFNARLERLLLRLTVNLGGLMIAGLTAFKLLSNFFK